MVVVWSDGSPRGAIDDIELPEPWWQETASITDILPGCHVLRILAAKPDETGHMGGRVTYAVAHDGPIPDQLGLRPWPGELDDHPKRLPWARPGGPAADLEWVASMVTIDPNRPPRQQRTWNLSAIWSIPVQPTDRSGGHDQVWLKCVPPFFAHEGAILDIMADQPIPRLLTADRHRLLLEPMPGMDGYGPTPAEEQAMVDSLVGLQIASADRIDTLLAAGVPDLRAEALTVELTAFVRRVAPDDPVLGAFVESIPGRMTRLDGLGLPDVLGHGDPHGGNCRRGPDPVLWFDWGDGFVGHPLLDVASEHRFSPGAITHWLRRWADVAGSADVFDLWPLIEPVSQLRMAWVYQRFCDNIEPNELIYHHGDVDDALDRVRHTLTRQAESR